MKPQISDYQEQYSLWLCLFTNHNNSFSIHLPTDAFCPPAGCHCCEGSTCVLVDSSGGGQPGNTTTPLVNSHSYDGEQCKTVIVIQIKCHAREILKLKYLLPYFLGSQSIIIIKYNAQFMRINISQKPSRMPVQGARHGKCSELR